MTIKVLHIYPENPLTFWSYERSLKIAGKKAANPPLGLATVAAMLPEPFESQRIIDLNVEPLKPEHLREADLIFTSSMVVQQDSLDEIIDRAHFYGKPVVSGGPYPTSYLERQKADFIVAGEAEQTLQPFLEDFVNGTAKKRKVYNPENVRDRINIPLIKNGKPSLIQTPVPRWDLLDLNNYAMAAVQYSRGCPFNCEFCDIINLFGRIPRTKSPEQMIEELNAIYNRGFRGTVFIVDDNFIGNKPNLNQFLPRLSQWQRQKGYPFSFITEASIDLAWKRNKDLLENMVNAGFSEVFIGIESPDPDDLKTMNKNQNLRLDPLEAVKKIQNAGLVVSAGFIIGNDGTKPGVFNNLYDFVQNAGIPTSMVGLLTALQNTQLHDRLKKERRLREDHISGSNTHHFSFNFEPQLPEGFTEESLIKSYQNLLERLYGDDKAYYDRCRNLQDHLKLTPHLKKADAEGKRIFFRFLKDQLLDRNLTWETAKYLIETLAKNPKYFPQAIGDAVKQQHFRHVTNESLRAEEYAPKVESWYENFVDEAKRIYAKYGIDLRDARDLIATVDFYKASQRVSKRAEQLILKAEKAYHDLHEDFRKRATPVLEDLKNRLNNLRESGYVMDEI
jgi:radical SAM superfamily enzyme YgiQ (UPF0313 family)